MVPRTFQTYLRFKSKDNLCVRSFFREGVKLCTESYFNNKNASLSGHLKETNVLDDSLAFVPISTIKQYLLKRGIAFNDGFTCISINCPACKKNDTPLFINKISGFFVCNDCKKSGNWNLLEMYFSSSKQHRGELPTDQTLIFCKNSWETLQKQLTPITINFTEFEWANSLKETPFEVLKSLDVRLDIKKREIYFPLMHGKHSVGWKKMLSDFSEETFPVKSAKGIVINKRQSNTALIVASLRDFTSLLASSLDCDIICLPHGEQSLPQEVLPLFEDYKKLILWFNNDAISWGNVKMFAKKLADERCYVIRPLETQPAPYECLQKKYDISHIVKEAHPISHSSIVTFANLREDVFAELHNADKVSGVKWERFPVLNSILKGHRRGELTILTGPTGTGKTTFMSEYSLDLACRNVTTLWGSFEIRNQRLAKTMLTQMFSAPLEKNLDKFNEWADKFERLPIYFLTFHGQQSLNIVMEAVEHATYVHDVAHVIIDNVQFMLGLSSGDSGFLDRFYRQDALIASFRNFASSRNCHVTLVIHPRKERDGELLTANSIFGGAKAAQEADNILIIQLKTSHTSMRVRKFLQIAKNRFSGDLGMMPLEFDKESLSFCKT